MISGKASTNGASEDDSTLVFSAPQTFVACSPRKKMDVNAYRRIGSIYVVICCLLAAFGAAVCLYQLMEAKPACRDFSCPDGMYSKIDKLLN